MIWLWPSSRPCAGNGCARLRSAAGGVTSQPWDTAASSARLQDVQEAQCRTMWLRQEAARRLFAREVSRDASPSTAVSSWLTSCRHVRNAPKERKSIGRSCCSRCACRHVPHVVTCCACYWVSFWGVALLAQILSSYPAHPPSCHHGCKL